VGRFFKNVGEMIPNRYQSVTLSRELFFIIVEIAGKRRRFFCAKV